PSSLALHLIATDRPPSKTVDRTRWRMRTEMDIPIHDDLDSIRTFLAAPFPAVKLLATTIASMDSLRNDLESLPTPEFLFISKAPDLFASPAGKRLQSLLDGNRFSIPKRIVLTPAHTLANPDKRTRDGDHDTLLDLTRDQRFGTTLTPLPLPALQDRLEYRRTRILVAMLPDRDPFADQNSEHSTASESPSETAQEPYTPSEQRAFLLAWAIRLAMQQRRYLRGTLFHGDTDEVDAFCTDDNDTPIAYLLPGVSRLSVTGRQSEERRLSQWHGFASSSSPTLLSSVRMGLEIEPRPIVDLLALTGDSKNTLQHQLDRLDALGFGRIEDKGSRHVTPSEPLDILCVVPVDPTWNSDTIRTLTPESLIALPQLAPLRQLLHLLMALESNWSQELARAAQRFGESGERADNTLFAERLMLLSPWHDGHHPETVTALEQTLQSALFTTLASEWDLLLGKTRRWIAQQGDGRFPKKWDEDPNLAQWIALQRALRKKGELSPERQQLLNDAGLVWDPEAAEWMDNHARLSAFRDLFGHANAEKGDLDQLQQWRSEKETATQDDPRHEASVEGVDERNDSDGIGDLHTLLDWIRVQRRHKQRRTLSEDRITLLNTLGLIWDAKEATWYRHFRQLQTFRNQTDQLLDSSDSALTKPLDKWVSQQRRLWRTQSLPEHHRRRLEDIGFVWDPEAVAWEEMFAVLQQFHTAYGHVLVPDSLPQKPELPGWIEIQRKLHKRGKLPPERCAKLESLGLIWESARARWQAMYHTLLRYRDHFGHAMVPKQLPQNQELADWCTMQRRASLRGTLESDLKQQLEESGFVWDLDRAAWFQMFDLLRAHIRATGDRLLPEGDTRVTPALAAWITDQRRLHRRNRLDETFIHALESVGCVLDPTDHTWHLLRVRLVQFMEKHGHDNVLG
ncbi:MAG: helicase associated domain-containing protein, partial [Magnetococcales bacterium]|nr:helicase associated domain-containing protein [Magnetococcales bacterium]